MVVCNLLSAKFLNAVPVSLRALWLLARARHLIFSEQLCEGSYLQALPSTYLGDRIGVQYYPQTDWRAFAADRASSKSGPKTAVRGAVYEGPVWAAHVG